MRKGRGLVECDLYDRLPPGAKAEIDQYACNHRLNKILEFLLPGVLKYKREYENLRNC